MNNRILAFRPDTWYQTLESIYNKPSIVITFQVTEDCCMSCTYCYQNHKTKKKMDFEMAKITIDKILNSKTIDINKFTTLIFEFIGGEPLMEIDLIEQITEYTLDNLIRLNHPWATHFKVSICSNGLLYNTTKVQNFLKKYYNFVSMCISIDGNEELHDTCRLDINGQKTYNKVIQAVYHFRKNYGPLNNTKMTISPENITYLSEAIIDLINNKFTEIFVNCIYEEGWNYSHAQILYNELKKIGDYLLDNDLYQEYYVRFFDEELYQPLSSSNNNNWCGGVLEKDRIVFSIDANGDIFPCVRYMESSLNGTQKPLKIGNIVNGYINTLEEKNNIDLLSNITRRSQSTDECFYCPIASGCSWCSAYNYEKFGTPNKRTTYICCMHKAASLANVYFINKVYRKLGLKQRFKMYLSKEQALNIIDESEYNYLLNLSQED